MNYASCLGQRMLVVSWERVKPPAKARTHDLLAEELHQVKELWKEVSNLQSIREKEEDIEWVSPRSL